MFTLCYVKCWVKLMYTFYKVLSKTHVHTLQCKVWTWVLLSLCKVWTWLFVPQFPYYSSFQQCSWGRSMLHITDTLIIPIFSPFSWQWPLRISSVIHWSCLQNDGRTQCTLIHGYIKSPNMNSCVLASKHALMWN